MSCQLGNAPKKETEIILIVMRRKRGVRDRNIDQPFFTERPLGWSSTTAGRGAKRSAPRESPHRGGNNYLLRSPGNRRHDLFPLEQRFSTVLLVFEDSFSSEK